MKKYCAYVFSARGEGVASSKPRHAGTTKLSTVFKLKKDKESYEDGGIFIILTRELQNSAAS
jgi:hypothetical protein